MQILKAFSCCATVHTVQWCELAEIKIQESKTVRAQNTVSGHHHTFLFQHLRQRPVLVHAHEDIATANEFFIDV
jgi:hypothetical protein